MFHAVCPAGEECRVHFVEGNVDACDVTEGIHRVRLLSECIKIVEVTAVDAAVTEGTEFDDVIFGKEKGEGVPDLFGISFDGGRSGYASCGPFLFHGFYIFCR
ncbi:hypothetical protein JCM10550A_20500 [Methanogenium cariaci]